MITKLNEYYMQNLKKYDNILIELNKKYTNVDVSFFIKIRYARKFKNFKYNTNIKNIEFDNENSYFKINLEKEDSFIIVTPTQDFFHERYTRLPKRIIKKYKTLQELIHTLKKVY